MRRLLRSLILVKKTSIKRLFLVFCLIALLFPVGCGIRQRRLIRYQLAQQKQEEQKKAQREATIERFMLRYPDNWQQKLHEYDVAIGRSEAGTTGEYSQPTTTAPKVSASKTSEEGPVENLGRFSGKIEKCSICGKTIPKLEQHFKVDEKIVCKDCFAKDKSQKPIEKN
jgi:hypothetical protein